MERGSVDTFARACDNYRAKVMT